MACAAILGLDSGSAIGDEADAARRQAARLNADVTREIAALREREQRLVAALDDAIDVAIWLTGMGDLFQYGGWESMRGKLNKAQDVRAALAAVRAQREPGG